MDYEKAYKETLERAKVFLKRWECVEAANSSIVLEEVKDIFPELAESEDERIKRNIIAALKGEGYYDCDLTNECIAWLEKQGSPAKLSEEDEKIRKELKRAIAVALDYSYFDKETADNCIAWLEKQNESKTEWATEEEIEDEIYWLAWVIGGLPDTEQANEAEYVLRELLGKLENMKGCGEWIHKKQQ